MIILLSIENSFFSARPLNAVKKC